MQRFLKVLMVLAMGVFLASPVMAAGWTVSAPEPNSWRNGQVMYRITVAYIQQTDSAGAETTLKTEMITSLGAKDAERAIKSLNGGVLYEVVTDPGTEPDDAYTLYFDCELGGSLLDLTGLSVSATEHNNFAKDLGYNPVFWNDLQIDPGDLGSTSDATTIYIYIVK
jgi:hypothetical protein